MTFFRLVRTDLKLKNGCWKLSKYTCTGNCFSVKRLMMFLLYLQWLERPSWQKKWSKSAPKPKLRWKLRQKQTFKAKVGVKWVAHVIKILMCGRLFQVCSSKFPRTIPHKFWSDEMSSMEIIPRMNLIGWCVWSCDCNYDNCCYVCVLFEWPS